MPPMYALSDPTVIALDMHFYMTSLTPSHEHHDVISSIVCLYFGKLLFNQKPSLTVH